MTNIHSTAADMASALAAKEISLVARALAISAAVE